MAGQDFEHEVLPEDFSADVLVGVVRQSASADRGVGGLLEVLDFEHKPEVFGDVHALAIAQGEQL